MGRSGAEGGSDDDYYDIFGLDEDIIPGDNDLPGYPQAGPNNGRPLNRDAPNNLCHIPDNPGDGGPGSVNIEIDSPVAG